MTGFFDSIFSALASVFYIILPGYAPKPYVDYGVSFGPVLSERAKDVDTLARTIWGESRNEGYQGMQAVANVCINRFRLRAAGKGYPSFGQKGASIAQICRAPLQFSCWNSNDPNLPKMQAVTNKDVNFRTALQIAELAVKGSLPDITGGADHYHTTAIKPGWSAGRVPVTIIGSHKFYKIITSDLFV